MKKVLFWLGTVLFIWPLVALIAGVIKSELINTLSFGLYELMIKVFSDFFTFIFFLSLVIIGFCFMYFFSPEKK